VTHSTPVFIVRHAKAGSRSAWEGSDEARPLSKAGRRQAAGLATVLGDQGIARIITSPFVRCRETVEPLAAQRGLLIEPSDWLAEGSPLSDALRLVEKVADEVTVLCTHGDVIAALLDHLRRLGIAPSDPRFEKASTWVLDTERGDVTSVTYLPPPA
jgi:broad specificity phosphatase PhoE